MVRELREALRREYLGSDTTFHIRGAAPVDLAVTTFPVRAFGPRLCVANLKYYFTCGAPG